MSASVKKINNNRDNRIKQQKDERGTRELLPDYMPIRITWRNASAAVPRAPWWDVFLRGIGSIPDRFSNESPGVECRKDEHERPREGHGQTRRDAWGDGGAHRDQRVGHPPA